mgnify:CR=1 FL=1
MTTVTPNGPASTVQGPSKANYSTPVLPVINELNDFRSVNYNFTLSVLTAAQYNNPLSSYKGPSGDLGRIILQSGSGDPSNRVSILLPTSTGTTSNKFDFYIDDVYIEGIFGLNTVTGNTTATRIKFVVTEPMSMGLFFIALQQASTEQKFSNWVDAPFLLTLRFNGYDDSNKELSVPQCTRHFPIKISNIDMRVSAAGAIYECEAYPYNEYCHTPDIVTIKEDVTIQGKTVADILQSGGNSLQDAVNAQLGRMNYVRGNTGTPDSVRIIFPKENSEPFDSSKWYQDDIDCNPIARSNLSIENYSGSTSFVEDRFTEGTDARGHRVLTRDAVTLDTTAGRMTFGHGSSIIDAINQVMIISKYGKDCASALKGNRGDKLMWWKIETQVFFNPPSATGDISRVYVFRVIQYKVDASVFAPSGTSLPASPQSIPAKSYDYIFTGKNVDVLDLDLSFNATFRHAAFADYNGIGETSKITTLSEQQRRTLRAVDQISSGNLDFLLNPGVPAPSFQVPKQRQQVQANPTNLSPLLPVKTLPVAISTPSYYRGGVMTSYNETGTTNGDSTTKYVRQLYSAILAGVDMLTVELRIRGDVYYLGDSSIGNYFSNLTNNDNINSDMQINRQSSDNFININYKTPIDLDQATGLYTQLADLQTFSGMYQVLTVISTFKNGVFEQRLNLSRRMGQVIPNSSAPSIVERAVELPSGKDLNNYA